MRHLQLLLVEPLVAVEQQVEVDRPRAVPRPGALALTLMLGVYALVAIIEGVVTALVVRGLLAVRADLVPVAHR